MFAENTAKGTEIMTDFQFKALMAMVLEIMDRSTDLEDAKKAISKLTGELSQDMSDANLKKK
jgi:hypothetical protein